MFPGADLNKRVEIERRYAYGLEPEISEEEYPAYIFFSLYDLPKKKKDNLPDMFMGRGGLAIVSGAMHDLLQQFELGQTRFHEMPLYEYDQKTLCPGRWYFMHIREDHRTLVAEETTGIKPRGDTGKRWKWDLSENFKIAVNPSPVGELDLWLDRSLRDGLFFSDRLKTAVKAAGLNTRWLGFRPCKIVEAGV